jgi:peptidase M23-like protein
MRTARMIALLAVMALAVAPAASAERWVAPVGGTVTRGFSVGPNPFAGGQHRGADFAAGPGAAVRAACGGPVVVAGRVGASGRVVTIRCGAWRVTHQPLAEVAVAAGGRVARGTRIGTVAASRSHAGLHLGVRREGRRFGYVDPLRFLAPGRPPPPVLPRPRAVRRPPAVRIAPPPSARVVAAPPSGVAAPVREGAWPAIPAGAARAPVAPWPVWVGLGLLLAGAGVRWRLWRRREPLPRAVVQEVR